MKKENIVRLTKLVIALVVVSLILNTVQPTVAFDPIAATGDMWDSFWGWMVALFTGASQSASAGLSKLGTFELPAQGAYSGFTPLSASRLEYYTKSADPSLGGNFILMTVALGNGPASSVTGYLTKTVTDDGKYSFSDDFSIKFEVSPQWCNWAIQKSDRTQISRFTIDEIPTTLPNVGLCPILSDSKKHGIYVGGFPPKELCIKESPEGVQGKFSSDASPQFSAKITLKRGTEEYSGTISSVGQQDIVLQTPTKKIAIVNFAGGLITPNVCGSSTGTGGTSVSGYIPYYNNGKWNIISQGQYDNYLARKATIFTCTDSKEWFGFSDVAGFKECIDVYNADVDKAVTSISGFGNIITTSESSGILQLESTSPIQYPVVTMKIDAEFIGVVTNAGTPKITNTAFPEFGTGKTSTITATIKNIGDFDGHFRAYLECDSIFTGGNTIDVPTVEPGKETKAYLDVTSATTTGTGCCTVVAYDVANPSVLVRGEKTCTTFTQAPQCTPLAARRCNRLKIEVCTETLGWTLEQECQVECVQALNTASCRAAGQTGLTEEQTRALMLQDLNKTGGITKDLGVSICYLECSQKIAGLSALNPMAYLQKSICDFGCWRHEFAPNLTLALIVFVLSVPFAVLIFGKLQIPLGGIIGLIILLAVPLIFAWIAFSYTYIGWMIVLAEIALMLVSMVG